jgi:uncharacterized protein
MNNSQNSFVLKALLVISVMLLAGCASFSEPPKYYLLTPLPSGNDAQRLTGAPCVNLIIGPIRLPEYTNRPQIITRSTQNELNRAQFDLWAEPLSDTFSRIMAENLARLLCTQNVSLFLWNSSAPVDYRVIIEVIRMDGTLGKEAVLEAWWNVSSGKESKMLVSKQSRFSEPVKNQGYEAFVQAHSVAIESLSREIAQAINNLAKDIPPK